MTRFQTGSVRQEIFLSRVSAPLWRLWRLLRRTRRRLDTFYGLSGLDQRLIHDLGITPMELIEERNRRRGEAFLRLRRMRRRRLRLRARR